MTQKVFVVNLQGQGDTHLKVLDQASWDWLFTNEPMPDWMIQTYRKAFFESQTPGTVYYDRDGSTRTHLTEADFQKELASINYGVVEGSYPDNERAMMVPVPSFNGNSFDEYGGTIKQLNAFLKANQLEIEEEYEGFIW